MRTSATSSSTFTSSANCSGARYSADAFSRGQPEHGAVADQREVGAGAPHGRWIGLLNVRGAGVERLGEGKWRVEGQGGFSEPADVVDCGNAGIQHHVFR